MLSLPQPLDVRRSLAARLVAAAAVWSALVLIVGGLALGGLYRQSVLRQLDRELVVVIDTLAATLRGDGGGGLALDAEPNDPRFAQTFSGRYWQVSQQGAPALRSASLWDAALSAPGGDAGEVRFATIPGPDGQRLRAAIVTLATPQGPAPVTFLAAADLRDAEEDISRFGVTLWSALVVLLLGIVAAVVLQVRVGLAPLEALRRDVEAIRKGASARLARDYPREVAPLTRELNTLLEHNRQVVERARTHVGNLAHALKTPISVLLNESRGGAGPLAELVARQTEAMARNVDHYLRRAQAAARAEALGARVEAAPVLEELARTLEKLHGRAKDLDLEVEIAPGAARAAFRGERQDFEEMAGNLLDNACKYGRGVVRARLGLAAAGDRLVLAVEDDGPGLAPEEIAEALRRGGRLDETAPGQGLGLAIVADLAKLYGGALTLDASPALGGLRATLDLPAAG